MQAPDFDFSYIHVLSIAGSDSGGGAGIQADLKTCAALGVYGMTAITAITAQNTQGVRAIHSVPPEVIAAQIDAVAGDIGVEAVKIGMLHAPEVAEAVAAALERHAFAQVVLDPVMVATSGSVLMEDSTVSVLVKRLFPLASVITPNLDEAALLLGRKLETVEQMRSAAYELQAMGARAVLLKGGHLPGERVADVLLLENGEELVMDDARIATRNTHGTGCTLSSAIASYLALGEDLPDAVRMAREFVRKALEAGANVRTGGVGNGPLNHGFAPRVMRMDRL
ncbi:MAG: bifunctional hydroxymethylpyrimidine kinase/phosphomethylpyrimidine kinase [Brachymonas denitrificans]|uniref:bifunctional hydroxymethylpyrimidine kinase/phosphomethylpyrimidine kinase n=1 Tax=Brachymonas denitrificans TaxID=28220 RepID=UPI001BCF0CB4|nr:bifunctional hydroxymethylpyrimidine kinase/phosphomethylpyrimidine kinase [Brachymonas denitrificans]